MSYRSCHRPRVSGAVSDFAGSATGRPVVANSSAAPHCDSLPKPSVSRFASITGGVAKSNGCTGGLQRIVDVIKRSRSAVAAM
jgi:hypothetical protein